MADGTALSDTLRDIGRRLALNTAAERERVLQAAIEDALCGPHGRVVGWGRIVFVEVPIGYRPWERRVVVTRESELPASMGGWQR